MTGWDWKGGAVAHWLPPVNIGMATASALNPQLLLCLYFVTYLFWFLFHNVLHLKFSGLWKNSGV